MRAHSMQVIQIHHTRALDAENPALTYLAAALVAARGAVIVEERVQARAVDEQRRVDGPQTPAICIRYLYARHVRRVERRRGEDRVVHVCVVGEGHSRVGVGLPVRRFRLDLAHEDVAGADELVLI